MKLDSLRDQSAIALWNDAYMNGASNLWGDPPVPYAEKAARLFADSGAFIVMDLPCGDGRNLPTLGQFAPVLIGADTSENALGISQKVLERAGLMRRSSLLIVDAYETRLPDNTVDGIFCWDLLGHLTEPERALRELHRIVRPGGHIVANMWTMGDCQVSDPNIKEISPKIYIDHFDFYCRFYDREDIDAFLGAAGIAAEKVELARWSEPPHVGYRDYEHDHESWVITIRK
jgi:SAM-dependent methyltransferase